MGAVWYGESLLLCIGALSIPMGLISPMGASAEGTTAVAKISVLTKRYEGCSAVSTMHMY